MHIDNKDLIKFENGTMTETEMIEFLTHLDHCDFCLDQITQQESDSPDTAPAYLADQILQKADSTEIQLARAANKASRKMQLLRYSLQTATGVAVALFLLFSVPEIDYSSVKPSNPVQKEQTVPDRESNRLYNFTRDICKAIGCGTDSVAQYLNNFSSNLMNGGK